MERGTQKKKASCLRRLLAWDWCLLMSCFIGVVVGFAIGFTLYHFKASPQLILWVGLPGELYLRMLKAAVLPLIISSIISGTAGLKPKENGKVSAVALGYIVLTNVIGAVIGTVLAVIIQPGVMEIGVSGDGVTLDTGNLQTSDLFADLVRNLVPDNVVSACFEKSQTRYRPVPAVSSAAENNDINNNISSYNNSSSSNYYNNNSNIITNITNGDPPVTFERYAGTSRGTNILGLIIACTVVGMASGQAGEAATPFLKFFKSSTDIILLLVQWLVMFTPVGAASLIASAVGKSSDMEETFQGLGLFVLAQVVGNLLLVMVMLPIIYFIVVRRHPFAWMLGATRGVITATVAVSSAVAMPDHMKCVESRHGVDKRVSSFVLPMACSLNRDGSAMFISLTSIYIAQIQGVATADTILIITILSAVSSIAIPAMPSASVVTILMVVTSLGVSPTNLGILLALEWFSDRMRTLTNNYSHVMGCLVTWHLCKSTLQAWCPEEGAGCLSFSTEHSLQVPPPHNGPSSKESATFVTHSLSAEGFMVNEVDDCVLENAPLRSSEGENIA